MNNNIIDLEFVTRIVEDLKNNPNAVTLEGGETKNGVFQMPFSITDETISKFFSSFYENELFDQNYLNNINKIENKDVEKLRPEEIFTYITFIHRQEHFSNGSLYGHFKSGLMLKLFIRLKELVELDSEVIKKVSNSFKLNKQIMESQNTIDQLLNDIDKKETSNNTQDRMLEIIEEYRKKTEKECYTIEYLDTTPNILDDKIGGIPYLPIGEEYPKDIDGNPMSLLFQINLSNVELENFPKRGILEVFISSNEKVVFEELEFDYKKYSTIKYFNEGLEYQTQLPYTKNLFIEKPIKIQLKRMKMIMPYNMQDDESINVLTEIIEEKYNIKLNYPMEVKDKLGVDYYELVNKIEKEITFVSNIGGYPYFINTPDAYYNDKKDTCLLYLASDLNKNLIFGADAGSFYVFIDSDKLKNKSFNKYYCNFEF